MASNENDYGLEHLLGTASLPRNVNPTLRGTVRRSDPDGGSSVPYFSGLTGKTLTVGLPSGDVALTFTSNGYQDTLDYINTQDPTNLLAYDSDGYLTLMNLNSGNKYYLQIKSGTAAPTLGFLLDPYPGSISYAGEVQSASAGRVQGEDNAPGTSLVGADEDLNSSSFNKALAGFAFQLYRRFGTTDILIPIVLEVGVTVFTHTTGGSKQVFTFSDDPSLNLRMPLINVGFTGYSPSGNELDSVICLLDNSTGEPVIDVTQSDMIATVQDVYYEEGDSHTLDNTALFSSWGSPDGKSIFKNPDVLQKIKHTATSITSINGDVIHCSGATFSTNHCWKGDTLEIESADNNTPFNHNGEYIITDVLDEETVRVRHAGANEYLDASADRPTVLNPNLPGGTSYGTAKVLIGKYFPVCSADSPPDPHVVFEVPSWVSNGSYTARILTARRLSSIQPGDLVRPLRPRPLGKALRDHIHAAYTNTKHQDDEVVATGPKTSGPYTLSGSYVSSQLQELLVIIDNLIAGEVSYGGGINWMDGSTNPARSLEAQVDDMLTQLAGAGNDGADKIRALTGGGGTLTAGSIRDQLDEIAAEWYRLDRVGQSATGRTTFSNINYFTTTQQVGEFANGEYPVFDTTTGFSTDRRLLWKAVVDTTPAAKYARMYVIEDSGSLTGGFEFTYNCKYESSVWSCDNSGDDAVCYRFGGLDFRILRRAATGGTWTDSGWSERLVHDLDSGSTGLLQLYSALTGFDDVDFWKDLKVRQAIDVGSAIDDNATEAIIPRIEAGVATNAACKRTRMFRFPNDDTADNFDVSVWRYNGLAEDALEIVCNAEWDNASNEWDRQNNNKGSSIVRFLQDKIQYRGHRATSSASWADTDAGWADHYLTHGLWETPMVTGKINQFEAKNIVKGFALLETEGDTTNVVNLLEGFNFDISSTSAETAYVRVYWEEGVTDDDSMTLFVNYYDLGTNNIPIAIVDYADPSTPSMYCDIRFYKVYTGTLSRDLINPRNEIVRFSILMMGAQP